MIPFRRRRNLQPISSKEEKNALRICTRRVQQRLHRVVREALCVGSAVINTTDPGKKNSTSGKRLNGGMRYRLTVNGEYRHT